MSDEFIIKRKLLFDGEGDDKRINNFLKNVTVWAKSNSTEAESEAMYNMLQAQLASIVASRKKSALSYRALSKQKQMFTSLSKEYSENIRAITHDINEQKDILTKAKEANNNYTKFKMLLETVKKEPSCQQSKCAIASLNQDLSRLENMRQDSIKKLDSTVKHCLVLSTSVNTAYAQLEHDIEM